MPLVIVSLLCDPFHCQEDNLFDLFHNIFVLGLGVRPKKTRNQWSEFKRERESQRDREKERESVLVINIPLVFHQKRSSTHV